MLNGFSRYVTMAASSLSKHVQTIVVSVATALLGWVGYSIQELKVEVAVLSVKVDQLEQRAAFAAVPDTHRPTPDYPFTPERHALPVNFTDRRK